MGTSMVARRTRRGRGEKTGGEGGKGKGYFERGRRKIHIGGKRREGEWRVRILRCG